MASIVPGAPEDYYLVVNHYGRFGTAETDLDRANYETTVADLKSGTQRSVARGDVSTPRPIGRRMFRTPSRRKYSVASAFKGATCRPCWRTSLIATSAKDR